MNNAHRRPFDRGFHRVLLIILTTQSDACDSFLQTDMEETRMARYAESTRDALADAFNRDGFVLLRNHFPRATIEGWRDAFCAAARASCRI